MKKIISLILVIVLSFSSVFGLISFAGSTGITIEVSSAEAKPGDTVTIELRLTTNSGVAGLTVTPKYDKESLTLSSVVNGSLFSSLSAEKNFVWDSATNVTKTGVLATLAFVVSENATNGDYSVELISRGCVDISFNDVTCNIVSGIIKVDSSCKHVNAKEADGTPANCTATGLTDGVYCPDCLTWIVEQQVIPKTEHVFSVLASDTGYHWTKCLNCDTVTQKIAHAGGVANCVDRAICSTCNTAYGSVDKTNHKTVVTDKAVTATCTTSGKTAGSHCSACDTVVVEQTETAKLGHTGGTATCTSLAFCTRCGKSYGEKNPAKHTGTAIVIKNDKEATCTEKGYTGDKYWSCCGVLAETGSDTPALGHSTQVIPAVEATCTETGLTAGLKCTRCNVIITAQIPVKELGHTWNAGTVTKEANCVEKGIKNFTCTVCKATRTEDIAIDSSKHKSVVEDKAVAATCIAEGKTAGSHCSACNKVIVAQKLIAKTAHDFDNGVITKEPTATTEGVKTYTCTVCGTTKTEPIPSVGILFKIGDVDDDGTIQVADARLALRAAINLTGDKDVHSIAIDCTDKSSRAFLAADANRDKSVNVADARLILRAAIGLENPETW